MNQLTRVLLLVLTAAFLLVSNYHTSAYQQEKASSVQVEEERLVLEITSVGKEPFRVPVLESRAMVAIIPVSGSEISAVRIIPWIEDGLVNIEISALYGDVSQITSCEELRAIRTESVGSYHAAKGDVLVFSELIGFGVQPFNVSVVSERAKAEENGLTSGSFTIDPNIRPICCACGKLLCCPSQGNCLTCDVCGSCCLR